MIRFLQENKKGLIILCIAAIFIVVGIVRQEQNIVLQKAVNICLECIGIG